MVSEVLEFSWVYSLTEQWLKVVNSGHRVLLSTEVTSRDQLDNVGSCRPICSYSGYFYWDLCLHQICHGEEDKPWYQVCRERQWQQEEHHQSEGISANPCHLNDHRYCNNSWKPYPQHRSSGTCSTLTNPPASYCYIRIDLLYGQCQSYGVSVATMSMDGLILGYD